MSTEDKQELNFDSLSLMEITSKKNEVKKRLETKMLEDLKIACSKKSERRKASKILEKIQEQLNILIALDEAQDRKDD